MDSQLMWDDRSRDFLIFNGGDSIDSQFCCHGCNIVTIAILENPNNTSLINFPYMFPVVVEVMLLFGAQALCWIYEVPNIDSILCY